MQESLTPLISARTLGQRLARPVRADEVEVGVLARERWLAGRRAASGHRQATGDSGRHVLVRKRGHYALGLGVQIG